MPGIGNVISFFCKKGGGSSSEVNITDAIMTEDNLFYITTEDGLVS